MKVENLTAYTEKLGQITQSAAFISDPSVKTFLLAFVALALSFHKKKHDHKKRCPSAVLPLR